MWRCVCSRCGVCLCVLRRYSSPDPAKFMRCFRKGTSTTDRRPKTRFLFYVLPQALRWRRSLLVAGCLRAVLSLSSLAWHLPLARSSSETLHSHTGVFFRLRANDNVRGMQGGVAFYCTKHNKSIQNAYKSQTMPHQFIALFNCLQQRNWEVLANFMIPVSSFYD